MKYAEFLNVLENCNLTIRAFAELVGMNPNSISNYARKGELPTHLALIVVLIGELSSNGLDYKSIMEKVEIAPKKPRGRGREGQFGGNPQISLGFDT